MTIVLIGKAFFWGGWPSRTEVIGALGIYIYIYTLGGIIRWVVAFVGNLEFPEDLTLTSLAISEGSCAQIHDQKFFSDALQKVCFFFRVNKLPGVFFFLEKKGFWAVHPNWKKQTNTSETKGVVCEPFVSDEEKKMRLFDFPSWNPQWMLPICFLQRWGLVLTWLLAEVSCSPAMEISMQQVRRV